MSSKLRFSPVVPHPVMHPQIVKAMNADVTSDIVFTFFIRTYAFRFSAYYQAADVRVIRYLRRLYAFNFVLPVVKAAVKQRLQICVLKDSFAFQRADVRTLDIFCCVCNNVNVISGVFFLSLSGRLPCVWQQTRIS